MPIQIEVKNPRGGDTPSEYMVFPDYFPYQDMENAVREKFPDKLWPEEMPLSEEERPVGKGIWNRFMDAGWKAHDQAKKDYAFGSAILQTSTEEAVEYLENSYQKWKANPTAVDEYELLSAEFFGETFGSIARDMALGISTGVAAGIVTTPLGGIITGGGVVATAQGVTAKGGSIRNTYFGERWKQDEKGSQNIESAYETARKVSNSDATTAVAEAGASIMIPIPGVGKGLTRVGTKLGNELLFDATIGASGSAISDAYAVAQGVDRGDRWENSFRSGLQEMIGGSISTGVRGMTEWGVYVTDLRAAQEAAKENETLIDDLVVKQAEAPPEEKRRIALEIHKAQGRVEGNKQRIKDIEEGKVPSEKVLSYDWENPTGEAVFIPQFDGNGLLESTKAATPADIEMLSSRGKVPNIFTDEIFSIQNESGRAAITHPNGERYEVFNDGSINQYPLRTERKIVETPDGNTSSLNEGGGVSNSFKAPIPTTRSWKEFAEDFGYRLPIEGITKITPEVYKDSEASTFVDRYTLEDGDTFNKELLVKDFPVFGLDIYKNDLPNRISEGIGSGSHLPEFMNRVLNDLSLGNTKVNIEESENEKPLVFPDVPKIQLQGRDGNPISMPVSDFSYQLPTALNADGTKNFSEQLRGKDILALRQVVMNRMEEIEKNRVTIKVRSAKYDKEYKALVDAKVNKKITKKQFDKRSSEFEGKENKKWVDELTAIPLPNDDVLKALSPFLSHPQKPELGPYPHFGDRSKALPDDYRQFARIFEEQPEGGRVKGAYANLDNPYSNVEFKSMVRGLLEGYRQREAKMPNSKRLDPNWKWTDSKIKKFITEFHKEVGRNTVGIKQEGMLTVDEVKRILAGEDLFSDTLEGVYYINAMVEDRSLYNLEQALLQTHTQHQFSLAEALAQDERNSLKEKVEGPLDAIAHGLHQKGMVDTDNFDYVAFTFQQLKIAQYARDAEEQGLAYTPPPPVSVELIEKKIAQSLIEKKPTGELGKFELPFGNVNITLNEVEQAKEFYDNNLLLPKREEGAEIHSKLPANEIDAQEVKFYRRLNQDFGELEKNLHNVLKWLWYTDTSKWIAPYTKGAKKGQPNPNNILFKMPKVMYGNVTNVEDKGKPQIKPSKYLGKVGDVKSKQPKLIQAHLNTIETWMKKNKSIDFEKVQKQMLLDLKPAFSRNTELINDYLKTVQEWKQRTNSNFSQDATQPIKRHMRKILAGFNALGKVQGAVYANMFFNPGAIPQIYTGLVGLAAHLHHAGIRNVKEFAKAIGTNVTKAVDMAWNDGIKGIYRTMYNLPWQVVRELVRLVTPSRETIEKMVPPILLDWSDAKWDAFYKKHSLEDYLKEGEKGMQLPPVQALLKRNFIDKYHDLASIMARVGVGLQGQSLDERLMEIKDHVNAAYKLDALETILGEKMTDLNTFQDKLGEAIVESKVDVLKFADWLKARHAPSRNARIAEINPEMATPDKPGSGMTNARAGEILNEATREGKAEDYWRLAEDYIDPLLAETLTIGLDSGLITPEEFQRLRTHYEHYIPLRGKEDSDEVIQVTGNGIEAFGPEWQRSLGRTSEAPTEQVLPYIFQQYFNIVYRAEKNKVAQSLRQFVIENPNDEIKLGSPDYVRRLTNLVDDRQIVQLVNNPNWYKGKDILALKVEGKNKYLRIKNSALAHELKGTGAAGLKEYTRGVGQLTKLLSKLNTQYNPSFILPNFARDIQFAGHQLSASQSKELAKKVANIMNIPALLSGNRIGKDKKGVINDAFMAIWRHNDPLQRGDARKMPTNPAEIAIAEKMEARLEEMIEYGGKISFYGYNDFQSHVSNVQKLSKKVNKANAGKETPKAIKASKDLVSWFAKAMEGVNGSFETSTRLAIFSVMRDYGFTPQQAAYTSRNTTINFTRKGRYGSTLNDLYMFFNPSIQGSYNIYKSLFHTEKGKKIFFNIFAGGFALEALNQAISGEDEEGISYYDKIPEWKRKHNMILMNPWTGKQALAIPLPYGFNVIHYMGGKATQVARDGYLRSVGGYTETQSVPNAMRPSEAALHIMSAAANAFNPIGGDSTIAKMISPDVLDPWLADLPSNRDWKGATIVPEPSQFAPYVNPDSERYWQTVGVPFKTAAQTINKITGGNEVEPGWMDFSPETLEHLTEYYTGGAGKFTLNFYKLIEKMATGKEIIANDVPLTRRFVAAPSNHYELERFKELREMSFQATDLYKAYRKAGRHSDAKNHQKLNKSLFRIQASIKSAESKIRKVNKSIRVVTASKSLSYQEKTARIRKLKQLKNDAMRRTHARFIDLVSPQ